MFMRYRGGGVGHIYMRAIEAWLAETGWGSDDTPTFDTNEDSDSEGSSEDSGDSEDDRTSRNSEDEVLEDDAVSLNSETTGSEQEIDPDVGSDVEYLSSDDGEETMDGQYGFSSL
jgi:hypothetical protein